MSWLEDKIKGWEASDDVDWLKAQLEVMAGELAAAEKRAEEAEDNLRAACEKLDRQESRLHDAEKRAEVAKECWHSAENDRAKYRDEVKALRMERGRSESRLRDAEAREAVLVAAGEQVAIAWSYDNLVEAQKLLLKHKN